uniref:Uncharacterized protein n=1 Tax=Mycena chlorophos TaxID=658473 RepID=A0ABQ0LUE8_MYCCL|nr:predicted protein [Mycena chlorophos]
MFFESATVKKAATATKPNGPGKEDVAPGVTRATKRARTSTTTSSSVGPSNSFQDARVGLQPALALADETVSRKRKRTDSIVDDRSLRPTENVFTGGKLDIYAMSSITLRDALKPVTSSRLNYITLLRIIHEKQTKPHDNLRSGEVDITFPSSRAHGLGHLSSKVDGFYETITSDERTPFQLSLKAIQRVDKLVFGPVERRHFWPAVPENRAGLYGVIELSENVCGVKTATGIFKMTTEPVYANGRDALYAGLATLRVQYGPDPRRGGLAAGTTSTFAFWGVRAKEKGLALCPPPLLAFGRPSSGSRMLASPDWRNSARLSRLERDEEDADRPRGGLDSGAGVPR